MKHANSILETFEYFCQKLSKSNSIILSYTVSNLVHFFETQCRCSVDKKGRIQCTQCLFSDAEPARPTDPSHVAAGGSSLLLSTTVTTTVQSTYSCYQVSQLARRRPAGGFTYRLSFNERKDYITCGPAASNSRRREIQFSIPRNFLEPRESR